MSSIQQIERKSGPRYQARLKRGSTTLKTKMFSKKHLARQWLRTMESDQEQIEALGMSGAKLTFQQLTEEYLAQWQGTDASRVGQVNYWRGVFGNRYLPDISTPMIREALKHYKNDSAKIHYGGAKSKPLRSLNRPRKAATVTSSFSTGVRVDHTEVIGSCISCHNGNTATGKHPSHIASDNSCDDCHNTNAWTPAVFAHPPRRHQLYFLP